MVNARAARYSKVNLDIVLSCLDIQVETFYFIMLSFFAY